jgi:hypothetical protein
MNRKVTPWRLVEDDEPGAEGQRPGDLHELPLLHAQITGRALRIHVHRPRRQQLLCPPAHTLPADQPATAAVVPVQEEVLGHGQRGDDRRLLVDAGHPLTPGVAVGESWCGAAAEGHRPLVGGLEAGEDGHQGRLAGAVAADERVGLTGPDGDPGAVQGHRRTESLDYARRLDDGRARGDPSVVRRDGRGGGRSLPVTHFNRLVLDSRWFLKKGSQPRLLPHSDLSSLLTLGTPP